MTGPNLDKRTQKWIKEGRGQGMGQNYKPWLTVRDVPSSGRTHRLKSPITGRLHHVLSDMELKVFFMLSRNPAVTDIREQFPLKVEDTLEIARRSGIRHPEKAGHPLVMTTDFLIDFNRPERPRIAVQVKPRSRIAEPRTIEKLELERLYWESKGVPWVLATEEQIPNALAGNLDQLLPHIANRKELPENLRAAHAHADFILSLSPMDIKEAASRCDEAFSLQAGKTLRNIHMLLARRILTFDIRKPLEQLSTRDLALAPAARAGGYRLAANQ